MTFLFILALAGAILCGHVARARGRYPGGWFLLGLLCWPLVIIALMCLPNLKAQKLEQQRHDEMMALLAVASRRE